MPTAPAPAIIWRPTLPAPPSTAIDTAGIRVAFAEDAPDPLSIRIFADVLAAVRAQQILRWLSAKTNRVLAGTRVSVIGGGPLATAVADALERLGARPILVSDDPIAALRHRLRGRIVVTLADSEAVSAEHRIVTGEGHPPAGDAVRRATTIDASYLGSGITAAAPGAPVRAAVTTAATGWIVAAPPVWDDPAALRAFLTLSALAAQSSTELEARFATEVRL